MYHLLEVFLLLFHQRLAVLPILSNECHSSFSIGVDGEKAGDVGLNAGDVGE